MRAARVTRPDRRLLSGGPSFRTAVALWHLVLDQAAIRCAECDREVDEFTAIAEKWGYWSDGVGELVPPRLRDPAPSAWALLCG